jgi:hypothetical protein
MKKCTRLLFLVLSCIIFFSCNKDHSLQVVMYQKGTLALDFIHMVEGVPLLPDTLIYITSQGNQYEIDDLQYFISGVSLHSLDGNWITFTRDASIHYVDMNIPSTMQWKLAQQIPEGSYDSIGFIFGLDQASNTSGRFSDPPERDMFWPDILGGGYHYMKMNLKWKRPGMTESMPFMFHLGIGQMYAGSTHDPDSIIGFIQNYFSVKLPIFARITPGTPGSIGVVMNIEKWFDGENTFDFSNYAMGIMQDQLGMYQACQNGREVFSIQYLLKK